MVEQERFAEQYAQMSPLERNNEFRQLYGQLPAEVPFDIVLDRDLTREEVDQALFGPWERRMERGDKSEHRMLLMTRFRALLRYSCFTDSGQEQLLDCLDMAYNIGVPKPETDSPLSIAPEDDIVDEEEGIRLSDFVKMVKENSKKNLNFPTFLLDERTPESAGIFDPQRGDLEWRYYDWHVNSIHVLKDVLVKEALEGNEMAVGFTQNYYSNLDRWQTELITKHGDR